jgi:hypothetical protein
MRSLSGPLFGLKKNRRKLSIFLHCCCSILKKYIFKYITFFCSEYQSEVPFLLIFGIATTVEAIHRSLPHSTTSKLAIESFASAPSIRLLAKFVESLVMDEDLLFKLGGEVLKTLLETFSFHDLSVRHFLMAFKVIIIRANIIIKKHSFVHSVIQSFSHSVSHSVIHNLRQVGCLRARAPISNNTIWDASNVWYAVFISSNLVLARFEDICGPHQYQLAQRHGVFAYPKQSFCSLCMPFCSPVLLS